MNKQPYKRQLRNHVALELLREMMHSEGFNSQPENKVFAAFKYADLFLKHDSKFFDPMEQERNQKEKENGLTMSSVNQERPAYEGQNKQGIFGRIGITKS